MSTRTEFCYNCGVPIGEPSAFCSSCGVALAEPEFEPVPEEAVGASARSASPSDASERHAPDASPSSRRRRPAPSPSTGPQHSAAPSAAAGRPPAPVVAQGPPSPGASLGTPPPGTPPPAAPPSGDPPPESSRNWVPIAAIGGGAIVVAGMVAALLLALGGSAGNDVKSTAATRQQALQLLAANGTTTVSRAAPGLFAAVTTGRLSAIVPAGWRATAQAVSNATRAEFADPAHTGSTLTIVAQQAGGTSDRDSALTARRSATGKGYVVSSFGPTTFPGGRRPWHLTYTAAGVTHETYFYSACSGGTAMVVDVAASSGVFQQQQTALEASAASAEPSC